MPRDPNLFDHEAPLPVSDTELLELEAEIPLLAGLRAFAEQATHIPWFTMLGRPLDREVKTLARSYLDGLGFPDTDIARVSNWVDAIDAALTLDIDTLQWETEESLRADLTTQALEQLSEHALSIALTHVASLLGPRIGSAIRDQAMFWDIADEGLLDAATGAAVQAAHGAALALVANTDDDHPMRRKFALFARGRWPIGIAGMTFNLF